jgi:superfamily II DNA or RNA helicase
LRGRQIGVINQIAESVKAGHKRIMIQAPTGYGKTVLAAHLMDRSAKKGKRPMFVAPAIALIEQTLKSFEDQGIRDIGVIQAQHARTDWAAQVQIASRDTLVRRALPEVDFVIVDEAHDQRDKFNQLLTGEEWNRKIIIGLSATPWSKGLGLVWDDLIIAATMKDMIADGAPTGLSRFKVYSVAQDPNMQGVKTVNGDFEDAGTARVMSDDTIVGDTVQTWLKHRQLGNHPGDRTFLYGVVRTHAKALMEAFNAVGVSCGYIDGESSPEERLATFKRYRSREDKVLANVGVLVAGVDEDVRCIIDAAPTKSEIKHVQRWGRGARLADGKDYVLGLDHAGNCTRLGLPEDIHHSILDMRSPKDKSDAYADEKPTPKPRKCRKCFAIIPPATRACPACGDVYVKPNTVEHVAGELVELGATPKKAKKAPKDLKQEWFSSLLGMAHDRGYKEGWAANKYREHFGVWPSRLENTPKRPIKAVRDFEYESRKKFLRERKASTTEVTHEV